VPSSGRQIRRGRCSDQVAEPRVRPSRGRRSRKRKEARQRSGLALYCTKPKSRASGVDSNSFHACPPAITPHPHRDPANTYLTVGHTLTITKDQLIAHPSQVSAMTLWVIAPGPENCPPCQQQPAANLVPLVSLCRRRLVLRAPHCSQHGQLSQMASCRAVRFIAGKAGSPSPGFVQLQLRVRAGTSRDREGILAVTDSAVEICVTARPRRGDANKAVVELLSSALGIPKSRFQYANGLKSKGKVVMIDTAHGDGVQYTTTILQLLRTASYRLPPP
jgi:uncharacterized protein YggU (UPF0235/DUF167 family)